MNFRVSLQSCRSYKNPWKWTAIVHLKIFAQANDFPTPSMFKHIFRGLQHLLSDINLFNLVTLAENTLQETNISHLGKRNIIFKSALVGDMLVPRRVGHLFLPKFVELRFHPTNLIIHDKHPVRTQHGPEVRCDWSLKTYINKHT